MHACACVCVCVCVLLATFSFVCCWWLDLLLVVGGCLLAVTPWAWVYRIATVLVGVAVWPVWL